MTENKKEKAVCRPVVKKTPAKIYCTEPVSNKILTKIIVDDPKFTPQYQTEDAACCDLIANLETPVSLAHRCGVLVDCGFSMEIPVGYKAVIVGRSGLSSKGLVVPNAPVRAFGPWEHIDLMIPNSPGQIDSDYRGRVKVFLLNVGREIMVVKPGDRVAQMYIEEVKKFDFGVVEVLSPTKRNKGGFGSTGT
jgi:dUTP pyrophosphatase